MAAIVGGAALLAAPAAATTKAGPPPAAVQEIARCRAIAQDAERLRCFDQAADQLQAAVASHRVYVLEQAEVRKTRRELFGLPVLKESVISEDVDDENKVSQIDATVASASQTADGNWTVTLDTGATWRQTDGYPLAHGPRRGDAITIKRAALGSYKMTIAGQPGVRARRVL